jgi:hypothetical protein
MVSSIQVHPEERFARSGDATGVCPDLYMTKPVDIPQFLANVHRLTGGERLR